jgi:predicted TIM-barrel fold metal-dependent hydrolase
MISVLISCKLAMWCRLAACGRLAIGHFYRPALAGTLILLAACTQPLPRVDPQLAAEIEKIKAIDNHAHPVRPGNPPDADFDALPVDNMEAYPQPIRTRLDSPAVIEARQIIASIDKTNPSNVLDVLRIDVMIANRVAMSPPVSEPRFRFAGYVDAFMYPLDNTSMMKDPDKKQFFPLEEKLLKRYYSESGVSSKPATLDDYLSNVVRATLERHKQSGAIAEKFEMAYLRAFDIGNPSKADAEKAYSGKGDYKALQDFIFRFLVTECGRLGMAVHIHCSASAGGYFDIAGDNPLLLEPLLHDPSTRKTNFVLLHGGWPYIGEITALLENPNVYTDFSEQTFNGYPREVSTAIRKWLEYEPEKVLFATDAYSFSKEIGWEEAAYIANKAGREALGIALTGMLRDEEIPRERAVELARMVLRENARKLYSLHE